jgi:hypothetical protein
MNPYSVLLLWPEYSTDDYGKDTFYIFVQAENEREAIIAAQEKMLGLEKPSDAYPLLVLSGHHIGLSTDL